MVTVPRITPLKVALKRFPVTKNSEDVLPWLLARKFELGAVNGKIEIIGVPDDMKLRDESYWPVLVSTEYLLEDKIGNGPDIVADINPDTMEMNIREPYWRCER